MIPNYTASTAGSAWSSQSQDATNTASQPSFPRGLYSSLPAGTASSSQSQAQLPPAPTLVLSRLDWSGRPTIRSPAEDPIEYGQYVFGTSTELVHTGWSSEFTAHTYKLKEPDVFSYTRECIPGPFQADALNRDGSSEIWGQPSPGPLFFVHEQSDPNRFVMNS